MQPLITLQNKINLTSTVINTLHFGKNLYFQQSKLHKDYNKQLPMRHREDWYAHALMMCVYIFKIPKSCTHTYEENERNSKDQRQ